MASGVNSIPVIISDKSIISNPANGVVLVCF